VRGRGGAIATPANVARHAGFLLPTASPGRPAGQRRASGPVWCRARLPPRSRAPGSGSQALPGLPISVAPSSPVARLPVRSPSPDTRPRAADVSVCSIVPNHGQRRASASAPGVLLLGAVELAGSVRPAGARPGGALAQCTCPRVPSADEVPCRWTTHRQTSSPRSPRIGATDCKNLVNARPGLGLSGTGPAKGIPVVSVGCRAGGPLDP
jgi:hypothetical protein